MYAHSSAVATLEPFTAAARPLSKSIKKKLKNKIVSLPLARSARKPVFICSDGLLYCRARFYSIIEARLIKYKNSRPTLIDRPF